MDAGLRAERSREGRLGLLGPSLVLALGLFAYRPLLLTVLADSPDLGDWFFLPETFSPLPVLGVAGWLLWRRRARLLSLPARRASGAAAALLVLAAGLFLWAHLTRAAELLFPSLAASLLAFAAATRGRAGCRAVLLPALVLLLGLRIPAPLGDELVWRLQLWTASGAAWVLRALGQDVVLGGVHLTSGERTFLVIESCSGLRGIQVLTLVALVVREFFANSGARQWLLIGVAPCLGYALNVVRVGLVIATTTDPQAAAEHTPQGLGVLGVGTALLYGLGWAMAGSGRRRAAKPAATADAGATPPSWRAAAAWLAALGVISLAVSPFAATPTIFASRLELPLEQAGWRGEDLSPDPLFDGSLPPGQALYRRYLGKTPRDRQRSTQVVELFVGLDVPRSRVASRLFSSRLALPGRDWSVEESREVREWTLGLDAELALVSRNSGSEHALVTTWRVRDEGLWREAARSLLALEAGPLRRERRRAVVRLATPLPHTGELARDRGRKILERFVRDFQDELAKL